MNEHKEKNEETRKALETPERGSRAVAPFHVQVHSFGERLLKAASPDPQVQGVDPFNEYYSSMDGKLRLIRPPYDPLQLWRMYEASDILGPCVSAMATNVDSLGWELERTDDPSESEDLPLEAEAERYKLQQFLTYVNPDENISQVRQKIRWDLELTGNAYMEVVRDRKGDIAELYHLPCGTCRIVVRDKTFTKFMQKRVDLKTKRIIATQVQKRFGRVAQMMLDRRKMTYFKEFGDPRVIGSVDGLVDGKGKPANEVIVFKLPGYGPYGLPRWIGQLVAVMGSFKAEEVNYLFFDNKTIPPMVVTVSGGALTQEALDRLEDLFSKELKGIQNFHKALVLEATPHSVSDIAGEKVTPVRINIQPLTEYIEKDAMFKEYRADNRKNVRSTFKLPPIYTGDTTDYTRATAFESARVAEDQVFGPERKTFDYRFNRTIVTEMEINYWKVKSIGAKTNDYVDIMKASGMIKEAIPVGRLQELLARAQGIPIGKIDDTLYHMTLSEHQAKLQPATVSPNQDDDKKPMDKEDVQKILKALGEFLDAEVKVIDEVV